MSKSFIGYTVSPYKTRDQYKTPPHRTRRCYSSSQDLSNKESGMEGISPQNISDSKIR